MGDRTTARVAEGVAEFSREEWDGCAGTANPFVCHDFLWALEESDSATARTGWQPVPIAIDGSDGKPAKFKVKSVIKDKDHHTSTMSMIGEDKKEQEMFSIEYTRKK